MVGFLWIYYSDQFLLSITTDRGTLTVLQSYKGWIFIFGSGVLLYLLLRVMAGDIVRAQRRTVVAYQATLDSLVQAIELRDIGAPGHSQRVVGVSVDLAHILGLPEEKMEPLAEGALLHDIGKIGVPDKILLKPAKLTAAEWRQMRFHAQRGYDLLSSVAHFKKAAVILRCHHERWDGSGYPRGLKRKSIPLEARIFAVADVWDALTSRRPYRPAWSDEKAFMHIVVNSGKLFDPRVVDAFVKLRAASSDNLAAHIRD